MGVTRYEDLRVWQEAKRLCDAVGELRQRPVFRQDHALREQLNAAVLSTMANIAEGFVRGRHREFVHFVRIAAGSNGEARALLHAAAGRGYLSEEQYAQLVAMTEAIGKMLRRLVETLELRRAPRTRSELETKH